MKIDKVKRKNFDFLLMRANSSLRQKRFEVCLGAVFVGTKSAPNNYALFWYEADRRGNCSFGALQPWKEAQMYKNELCNVPADLVVVILDVKNLEYPGTCVWYFKGKNRECSNAGYV